MTKSDNMAISTSDLAHFDSIVSNQIKSIRLQYSAIAAINVNLTHWRSLCFILTSLLSQMQLLEISIHEVDIDHDLVGPNIKLKLYKVPQIA